MININKIKNIISNEIIFLTSRSSGPGGQNVNKVNSKVELRFNIYNSIVLNHEEKQLLFERLKKRLTKNGELILQAGTERSQIQNKRLVVDRFTRLIQSCLKKERVRKVTKPNKLSIEKRLKEKQKKAYKKQLRIKSNLNHE